MRSFLPDDPPEPPPLDQDGDHADLNTTSSTPAASTGSDKQASDNTSAAGERSSSRKMPPGAAGDENNSGKGGSGNGRAGSPGDANDGLGGGGGAFVDEAATGGAGLLLASPPHLEPFLLPSSSSASPLMTTSSQLMSAAAAATAEVAAGGGVRAGVANGPGSAEAAATAGVSNQFVSSMPEVMPSKYHLGASGAGGAMGADERLWLVYDSVSAAGKGVVSKINAPDPYWLGRAPAEAVCPHRHSMGFCSSFESANLLRAVQVRNYRKVKLRCGSASLFAPAASVVCFFVSCVVFVPRSCFWKPGA